ncbi:MAG: type I-E CRISPR-associated protein Cas7/Cse4/CasC, partial [Methanomethylovorans sp.]
EKGKQQPRSLSVSYLEPIRGRSMLKSAIDALIQTNDNMEKVYGKCCEDRKDMNAYTGEGSLDEMLEFVVK